VSRSDSQTLVNRLERAITPVPAVCATMGGMIGENAQVCVSPPFLEIALSPILNLGHLVCHA